MKVLHKFLAKDLSILFKYKFMFGKIIFQVRVRIRYKTFQFIRVRSPSYKIVTKRSITKIIKSSLLSLNSLSGVTSERSPTSRQGPQFNAAAVASR